MHLPSHFPGKGFAASPLFFLPSLGPPREVLALVSQAPTYTHQAMTWHWIWKFGEEAGSGECVKGGREIPFTWLPLHTLVQFPVWFLC